MITEGQIIIIENAEYIDGYKIRLHFNDQTTQTINFENFIRTSHNPHIAKYSDLALFKNFSITDGDLEWNDYDLCFPIADLYENKNIGDFRDNSNEAA
ncbi:MAG: DUF2442 domain-containing protein [Sulfuricurvum sp.]|uniref:DUF2442 domain-containing protein n=1 Tax=Sulfuricurvum sp. TaxID=2025608 RepID=UPI0026314C72|nr:DUF2442 domain-containing protein [Sulfuricurvum sp.]MDD2369079.1 DUF2442 domain-containing protein [Sulfuricurvum sp.]MDD5116977.1 DUF2442 domain-containing protein [Sulfuricurvum sp.]